jgi:hypothetical protein
VPSLHRRLCSARLPQPIDLDQCTGSDHPVVAFLLLMADQNIDLKPDTAGLRSSFGASAISLPG